MKNPNLPRLLAPLALAAAVFGLAAPAEAHSGHRGRPGRLVVQDLNRDGQVTAAEFHRYQDTEARARARRLDRDGDGWIERSELRGRSRDLDRDGDVSRAERRVGRRVRRGGVPVGQFVRAQTRDSGREFRRLDRNRDGRLFGRELRSLPPAPRRFARR